jgi:hypothetical protein
MAASRTGAAEPHLRARLALMLGGAAAALAGSCLAWTTGTIVGRGHVSTSGLDADGKQTAALALLMLAAAAAFAWRPRRMTARAAVAAGLLLLAAGIYEWNAVTDHVSRLDWENGRWSSLTVGPGIYLLLFGSIAAAAGAIWTARMERG